ncbi:hypothetical protein BP6252_03067 [Coleophoma cylindrospora]|uniref:MOSC domain-containing protein n=1 Tax=Coleophoma cylindrospora TaxID=1849047 RepID=A0A3D8S6L2_9HELO|nr:hypothetical protein BP6252_03067 [Coleophoma cylindrospora]
MPAVVSPDPILDAPFKTARVRELRTGKLKPYKGLSITSGILKDSRGDDAVFCSYNGLESDEHDLTFHGGVDKAVHQYCSLHYPSWQSDFPDNARLFTVGGFGENIVSEAMNERNVCIGDIMQIGNESSGCILQVSLPRQPCYKLNHRFEIKAFASQTWKKSRTGWYYRVLKEGWMKRGDEIVLLERKHPKWTIERIQEYLHRDGNKNVPVLKELLAIEEFGAECKRHFTGLIAEAEKGPDAKKEPEIFAEYKLVEKKRQTPRIVAFTFEATDPKGVANDVDPGSHVRLKLPNGLIRSYSLVGGTTHKLMLGIALEEQSRGGSRYIHKTLAIGDTILVGKMTTSVPIDGGASHHVLIAGGIGITAFLPSTAVFDQINFNYDLHYAVRSSEDVAFKDMLEKMSGTVRIYDGSKGERMDIPTILKTRKWNSHIYVCGPQRMNDAVTQTANLLGIDPDEIHSEAFQALNTGDPFTFSLKAAEQTGDTSKRIFKVAEDESLLAVLRKEGFEVDSSCETGNCGACKIDLCAGSVEHRGSALGVKEKETGMLSCVSRGQGHIVIDF